MFVRQRGRVLQLCSREMFGDMVVVRQNPPTPPIFNPSPEPFLHVQTTALNTEDVSEKKKKDSRRTSKLVDELLFDIYSRDHYNHFSGYASASSSVRSQKDYRNYSECDLHEIDRKEFSEILECLNSDVVRMGSALVRKLKRRDALRRQRDAHCDVISDHLRKRTPEASDMKFSIEPGPGDSGFSQWHSAMRMVAQLPGGIPPEFRRKLWLNLADRHLLSRNVNWIKVERECFSEWSHPADAELGVQIVKDLHRTGCSLFCGEDGQENQALLKRVLLAYARWNKAVGYCQGFNMLAALILQVTEKCESEALKLMILLIEGVLPESYFADSLRGLSVDMAVFRELLKTRLPRLSRHLDTLQVAAKDGNTSYEPPLTNVFTMQWFLTLFCNCLPQPTVLRVWDLILLEGNEVLLRTALAIWQVVAERILSVRSADEFYCIMGVLTREILEFGIVDANSLVKAIVIIGPLTELPSLREKYLYNINPWGSTIEPDLKNRQLKVYGKERLVLDISALKKQYSKLKQRQRQAHIIFSAAVARQPPPTSPVVAMNHLLLGKTAIISAKRIGPPKGAIPPPRSPPSTLLWKDAPPRQSSSSSSSDTELCDDPDEPEHSMPKPSPPNNSQFQYDNLNKTEGDNLNLMNNTVDNTAFEDLQILSDDRVKEDEFDTELLVENVDDNQIKIIDVTSDIFDTNTTMSEDAGNIFDFSKYGAVASDSDDEGFDFEKFLETRVRCLKQTSVDEESVTSSCEDFSERKETRKNSQKALEIIQENSLILHRILQCQSRLTPSPPVQEQPDDNVGARLFSIREKETPPSTPDIPVLRYYSDDAFIPDTTDKASGSIQYYTYGNTTPSPENKYNTPTITSFNEENYKCDPDSDAQDGFLDKTTEETGDSFSNSQISIDRTENILDKPDYYDMDLKLSNNEDESDVRPSFTSILDSEYTRNLEEKYENLILKSSRPKFLDVAASLENLDCGTSSYRYAAASPVSKIDSPNFESSINKSPGDNGNFIRSPTSGRIYNPFPVNISSRQNKDVALRLGLYKKS